MRRLALATGLLLALSAASAQPAAFRPGYVVLASGDTLRGEVRDAPDVLASREVAFRPAPSAEAVLYTVETARAHGTDGGRRFIRHLLEPDYGAAPEARFAQLIVSGPVDLYRVEAREGVRTFYVNRDGYASPQGLFETRETSDRQQETARFQEVRARYRGTLARAFYGCPGAQERAGRVSLRESDLVRAVSDYNACVGGEADVALSRERRAGVALSVTPRLGAGAGYLSGRHAASLRSRDRAWRATPQQALPYVGLQVEAALLGLPARTSFVAEVSYQRKGQTPEGFQIPELPSVDPGEMFGTHYGVFSLGARYVLGRSGRPTGYVSAGIVNGLVLDAPERPGGLYWGPTPPRTEAGVFAEIGAEALLGGAPYALGVRVERTALGAVNPLAGVSQDLSLDNRYNTALSVVLGRRFGR